MVKAVLDKEVMGNQLFTVNLKHTLILRGA